MILTIRARTGYVHNSVTFAHKIVANGLSLQAFDDREMLIALYYFDGKAPSQILEVSHG